MPSKHQHRDNRKKRPAHTRYVQGGLERNTKRRAANHEKKILEQFERKSIRLELLEKALHKLSVTPHQLRNLIGTPNIGRLSKIIDGTYVLEKWYTDRQDKSWRKNADSDTIKSVRRTLHQKQQNGLYQSGDKRDRKTQVDRERKST